MFGSTTLDIALGITFLYLLLNLGATAIQEVIETCFANPLITAFSPNPWFGPGTREPAYIPSRAGLRLLS